MPVGRPPREVYVRWIQAGGLRGGRFRGAPHGPMARTMQLQVGDPFLGGLLRALGAAAKFAFNLISPQIPQLFGAGTAPVREPTPMPALSLGGISGLIGQPGQLPIPTPPGGGGLVVPSTGTPPFIPPGILGTPGAPIQLDIPYSAGTGGRPRRRRRMNPLNPRALRRALVRAERFKKFVSRTIQITSRIKPRKKLRIPRRRR